MKTGEALRILATDGAPLPRFEDVDRFTDHAFPVPALLSEPLPADEGAAVWAAADRRAAVTGLVPVLLGEEPMIDWFPHPGALRERFGRSSAADEPFQGRAGPAALARVRANPPVPDDAGPVLAWMAEQARQRFSAEVVDRLWAQMTRLRPVWRADAPPPSAPRFEDEEEAVRCALIGAPSWELPRWLGLGGFNDSPEPLEQGVFLRRWHHAHGARLLHIGRGTVDLWVDRPATTVRLVRERLWDVFLYNPDAVFADTAGTFDALRTMLAGPRWTFSWD